MQGTNPEWPSRAAIAVTFGVLAVTAFIVLLGGPAEALVLVPILGALAHFLPVVLRGSRDASQLEQQARDDDDHSLTT